MKLKGLFVICIAVLFVLLSALPVSANPCEGRENCAMGICSDCGCDWQLPCWSGSPCDPRHNLVGICVPCGESGQTICLSGADCDPWNNPILGVCTPCGYGDWLTCGSGPACKPGHEIEDWLIPECNESPDPGAEPTTGSTATVHKQPEGEPLWGWVDTHEHMFANLAYGGIVFWGKPYDEDGGVSKALAECDYTEEPEFTVTLPTLWGIPENHPDFVLEWLLNLAPFPGELDVPGWVGDFLSVVEGIVDDPIEKTLVQGWCFKPTPPFLKPCPRQGIHGDHWPTFSTSPTQFWLGMNNNIAAQDGPQNLHRTGGYPDFEGWPTYKNGGHQQMYHKWLERAYEGGLRLLIDLPVNNEVLCEMAFQREGFGCDDMSTVDRQIDAIHAMENFIDRQNDGLVNGNGWYRVATSASHARSIIEDGAMAVIIGIEVDTLFGCKPGTNYCCEFGPEEDCLAKGYTDFEDFISKKVQEYYDKGVRYIFPVHFWDNRFAGGALYRDFFVYAQTLANGTCFETWDCSSEGYSYKIGGDIPFIDFMFEDLTQRLGLPQCGITANTADCNANVLRWEGRVLLNELIARDMIFDKDHLNYRATRGYFDPISNQYFPGVLDICEDWDGSRGYKYPLVSSHSGTTVDHDAGAEGGMTLSELDRVRRLGGVVSVPVPRGECSTTRQFLEGQESINEDEVLFSVDAAYQAELDAGVLLADFRQEFADHGFSLSNDLTVETIKADTWWRIVDNDPDAGLRFAAQKVGVGAGARIDIHDASWKFGFGDMVSMMSEDLPDKERDFPRIGLRSDFGAFLPQTAPRHGPEAVNCLYNNDPSQPLLQYPFATFDPDDPTGKFSRCKTGNKTWDFNYDGLAHVGLYPDMLADARTLAGSDDDLEFKSEALFNSAEAYIRMWEWIERCTPDETPPDITCPPTVITSGGVDGVTVVYDPPPVGEDLCDWIPPDTTTVTADPPSGSVFPPGVTTVQALATDYTGNQSMCTFDVNVSCFGVNRFFIETKTGRRNKLMVKGTFRPATNVDPTAVDVNYTIDDGSGHTLTFTIPAGSFVVEGHPWRKKFRFVSPRRARPRIKARFDFRRRTFEFEAKKVQGTSDLFGSSITIGLQTDYGQNRNFGLKTVEVAVTPRHLRYIAAPQARCPP